MIIKAKAAKSKVNKCQGLQNLALPSKSILLIAIKIITLKQGLANFNKGLEGKYFQLCGLFQGSLTSRLRTGTFCQIRLDFTEVELVYNGLHCNWFTMVYNWFAIGLHC